MKKDNKHEPYCGCQNCKRARSEGEQHWQHRAEIMEAWLKDQGNRPGESGHGEEFWDGSAMTVRLQRLLQIFQDRTTL